MRTRTRILAAIGAAIAWLGLGLQFGLLVAGPLGVAGGAWRFIAFFTVLMNLLAACLFTRAVVEPRFPPAMARLQTASTLYMTVVGGVYVSVLQQLWDPQGLQLFADRLLHHATPIASILFWLLCVPKDALRWSDSLRWLGIPLGYCAYVLLRAHSDGFYPYFFLDVGQIGWGRAFANAGLLLLVFVVLGLAFVGLGRLLPASRHD